MPDAFFTFCTFFLCCYMSRQLLSVTVQYYVTGKLEVYPNRCEALCPVQEMITSSSKVFLSLSCKCQTNSHEI